MRLLFYTVLCTHPSRICCLEKCKANSLFTFVRCDEKSLEDSLCKRVIVTCDETITKCLDPDAATVSRDALAKIVYSRLFDW